MKRYLRRLAWHPRAGIEQNLLTVLGILALIAVLKTLLTQAGR
jgi:hypothetical protein